MDTSNTKDILEVRDVRLSAHKGAHLSDSDSYTDIGLSSEEEADELDPAPQISESCRFSNHLLWSLEAWMPEIWFLV